MKRVVSTTVMVKVSESSRGGAPASRTRTVIAKLPAAAGVQVNRPLAGWMLAPAGAPGSSEKVSVSPSTSVAETVKLTGLPRDTVRSPVGASTGASLTGLTVMPAVLEAALKEVLPPLGLVLAAP